MNILVELTGSMLPMDMLVNTQSLLAGAKDRVVFVQYSVHRHGAMVHGEDLESYHTTCGGGFDHCRKIGW